MNLLLNNKILPNLVDRSLYSKSTTQSYHILSLSFYFNIIIILILILGSLALYYRYINKEETDEIISNKINILNNKINSKLKNIT